MAKYSAGQRVTLLFNPAMDAEAAGDTTHVPLRWLTGPMGEAVIVGLMAPRREGLEEQYVVQFDDGQEGLMWESELTPVDSDGS